MAEDFEINELEKVLNRIREEQAEDTPPDEAQQPESNDAFAPIEPPKLREELQSDEKPDKLEKLNKEPKPKEVKPSKIKAKAGVIKANVKTRLFPAVKSALGKIFTRRLALAVLAIAVVAGAVFGGIKLYNYSKVAYLKPYVQKYGVDYPEGIREEFCDAYGMDQKTAGALVIDECEKEIPVGGSKQSDGGVMELGSTVLTDQHLRSVALENNTLEKYYSSDAAYITASQHVLFKTLFDDEDYQVVAAYYANTNPKNDNGYVFPYNAWGNLTERSFKSYIDRVGTRSLYVTGAKLEYEDYYLSINMPTESQPDSRFVLLCKRVDKKHFEKISKTTPNERIRHTQAWYDKNKQQNPYRLASKWYPQIYTDKSKTQTKQLTEKDF